MNWALINGDQITGNTLIKFSEKVDEGDIIEQTKIPITLFDNVELIYAKVSESNKIMFLNLCNNLIRLSDVKGKVKECSTSRYYPEGDLMTG